MFYTKSFGLNSTLQIAIFVWPIKIIKLHIGVTALHYDQSCFEILKVFRYKDGLMHISCGEENVKCIQLSCEWTIMTLLPTNNFLDAVNTVVGDNIK